MPTQYPMRGPCLRLPLAPPLTALLSLVVAACAAAPRATPTPDASDTVTPSSAPTQTVSPSPTETTPPPTPTPETPTPVVLTSFGPGPVEIPILLYHHISPTQGGTRYSLGVDAFEQQMAYLEENGYHSVTVRQVVAAIRQGTMLPPSPVVLTFDDGNLDTYDEAWPRLRSHGFVGVVYVVANRLGADGFLSEGQLQQLAAAGWEIGSHSQTHANLTEIERGQWRPEILGSKLELQRALGVDIESFAYPFGAATDVIIRETWEYGYRSGVGLGKGIVHDRGSLYYLQRREVLGSWDLAEFEQALSQGS